MKISIIKLGADGDVLRTLPIARAIKSRHRNAEITWITRGDIAELLKNIPHISKVHALPYKEKEKFDILYNFDIEPDAMKLAIEIEAGKKYGFYPNEGYAAAFNPGAEYYINTLFDDELKKSNKKTYQEMMFMAAELPYEKEGYEIFLDEKERKYAEEFVKKNNIKKERLIGLHMGASSRWPSKVWAKEKVREFIIGAKKMGCEVLLFGGPNEAEAHRILVEELEREGIKIHQNNPNNTKMEFAALVSLCKTIVCSDSFALHVSLGLKKDTIGMFFCTSPDEVEGYGLLKKVVSPMLADFFPEKMDLHDERLVNSISANEVMGKIEF